MRHLWLRLSALLFAVGLIAALGAAPASAEPGELRPAVPSQVSLTDGTVVALNPAASTTDLVAQLQGLREQLTTEGMALLGSLLALLPGANGPSTGQPTLTVEPADGIRSGATVSVSGSGYRAGENVYVTQTIAKPSSGYPTTYADAQKVTVDAKGGFQTTLKITTTFESVDCTRTDCFVASFTAFPKLTDRSQDAWVPISIVGGGAPDAAPTDGTTGNDGPAASAAGPQVSVNRASGLKPAGDTVTVSGTGFATSGPGVYVGIAQTDQFSATDQSSFGPDTVYVSTSRGNLRADGSFSVSLPVQAKFGRADCTANPCAVYTFAAHGSADRSQDTATPVAFVGGPQAGEVDVPADGGTSRDRPETGTDGPKTSATALSTTALAADGDTSITVSGTGFANDGPGVYVGLAETARYSTTDSSVFGAVTWVPAADISADGSFSTTLTVSPVFAAGNCLENPCAVYTFAAHGSSDRSQDTVVPVTVAGTDAEKDAAKKDAEEEKKAADGVRGDADNEENRRHLAASQHAAPPSQAADSTDGTTWWPWAVGAGAVIAAGAIGTYAVRRRSA